MTSQIRSHIEYLMQTYCILLHIFYSKFTKNLALMTVFECDLMMIFDNGLLFGPPCINVDCTLRIIYQFLFNVIFLLSNFYCAYCINNACALQLHLT